MEIKDFRPGILTKKCLEYLNNNIIFNCDDDLDDSAIDLHLSQDCYLMKGSLRLAKDISFTQIADDSNFVINRCNIKEGITLKPNNTYIIKLKENIRHNHEYDLFGVATGKSSIGRLDVLTRLIVDESPKYDVVPNNYNGPLFVEVTPITFQIRVKEGMALNQLRLFRGDPNISLIDRNELALYPNLTNAEKNPMELHLDLSGEIIGGKKVIAFTTQKPVFNDKDEIIDLTSVSKDNKIDPRPFWRCVEHNGNDYIKIERDQFYILRSIERFSLPGDVGVYCQAITENLGEIRIHYAGFAHPGFGYNRSDGKNGTPLIFEVRGHTVDAFLRTGELMANILFFRTCKEEIISPGEYENQELQLSKYFDMKKWEE